MKTSAKTIGFDNGYRTRRRFDEEILARWPRLWQRIAVMAFLALTMSGILPMAVATFQIWLGDTYGLWLTALCIVVDSAVIVWLVKRYA